MVVEKDFHVWAIEDKEGIVHVELSVDSGDDIYMEVCVASDQYGDPLYETFESDAYHLEAFAKEHELAYFHNIQTLKIEVPFE